MDSEPDPLLRSVVAWAGTRPDVRGVVLTGSRSAEAGTGDAVSDFDVDLLVDDPHAFGDDDWLEEIAPVLVASEDDDDGDPVRLVFFSAQRKVEFRLRRAVGGPGGENGAAPGTTGPAEDADGSADDGAAGPASAASDGAVLFERTADGDAVPHLDRLPGAARPVMDGTADDDLTPALRDAADEALHTSAVGTADGAPGLEPAPDAAVLLAVLPVLTAPDVPAWLAHYRALGFEVRPESDGTGLAVRDGLALRVVPDPDGQPAARGLVLVVVDDAEALALEWSAVPGGRTVRLPGDGPARFTHADPAGNVLRFGAPG